MRQRSFPAIFIAILLLMVCVFPLQGWLTSWFPQISGRATLEPSLTIFDIPIRLPFPIDLILVPALFILLYSITILIFSTGLAKRLAAVFMSIITILLCIAAGGLISWLIHNHLPDQIREGMRSLAVNAELHLPGIGYPNIHMPGDTLTLLGLIIGIAISIRIMWKSPRVQARVEKARVKKKARLTPEQRMTPYQRMLLERRNESPYQLRATPHEPSHGLCRNEPLQTLQPEAVNFRPLG
jgi:hypothetical protein